MDDVDVAVRDTARWRALADLAEREGRTSVPLPLAGLRAFCDEVDWLRAEVRTAERLVRRLGWTHDHDDRTWSDDYDTHVVNDGTKEAELLARWVGSKEHDRG